MSSYRLIIVDQVDARHTAPEALTLDFDRKEAAIAEFESRTEGDVLYGLLMGVDDTDHWTIIEQYVGDDRKLAIGFE